MCVVAVALRSAEEFYLSFFSRNKEDTAHRQKASFVKGECDVKTSVGVLQLGPDKCIANSSWRGEICSRKPLTQNSEILNCSGDFIREIKVAKNVLHNLDVIFNLFVALGGFIKMISDNWTCFTFL